MFCVVVCTKHHKNYEKKGPTSVRKVVLTVLFVVFVAYESLLQWAVKLGMFVPIFGDLGAFLRHILLHVGTFRQMLGLWGSLEASRGGMLEVIAMLKVLLLLFYFFCGKNHDRLRSDKYKVTFC